ncbi:hypothetical protein MOF05_11945 [Bacillus haynesii]|uniref:hypothetical protein n=2 Tax=Bacillus haynesii TaxID=1925021 RepID=UPI0022800E94|nr:hypothetical protein [Bacillus haynesii]MCY8536118.1 hypothetical protein [Bacillus haynesii]MCY9289103.1 hypothetical protein [Bacillus haynesii]MEC0634736.1 hypothetical protein [Bacillus haynesii]
MFILIPPYCFWMYPYQHVHCRQVYPEVEASAFSRSAKEAEGLMADGQRILSRLSASRALAHQIMTAAQSNQKNTVLALLRQTGVRRQLDASFDPDGIRIILISPRSRIFLLLRWS